MICDNSEQRGYVRTCPPAGMYWSEAAQLDIKNVKSSVRAVGFGENNKL